MGFWKGFFEGMKHAAIVAVLTFCLLLGMFVVSSLFGCNTPGSRPTVQPSHEPDDGQEYEEEEPDTQYVLRRS